MGLFKRNSSYSLEQNIKVPGNPDPKNFQILRHFSLGKHVVVEIKYPDCDNYEGMKILVYRNISFKTISQQKELDPHFGIKEEKIYPIARFQPTPEGWKDALSFVRYWQDM